MTSYGKHLDLVLAKLRRSEKRSALFHWLAEHHDEMLEAAIGERIDWPALAKVFEEAGLTDATGKPATARTARATWYKVRRVVASRRANEASARPVKIMPSRLPAEMRPAMGPVPASAPAAPMRAATPSAGDWPTASRSVQPKPQPGEEGGRKLTGTEKTERLRQRLQTRNY
jgi:hypothetical protein